MDFDETRLYYSQQQLQRRQQQDEDNDHAEEALVVEDDEDAVDLKAVRRHFREFLSKFREYCYNCDCTRSDRLTD